MILSFCEHKPPGVKANSKYFKFTGPGITWDSSANIPKVGRQQI